MLPIAENAALLTGPSCLRYCGMARERLKSAYGDRIPIPNNTDCNPARQSLSLAEREVAHASITAPVASLARHDDFDGPQGRQGGDRGRWPSVDRPDRHQSQRQEGPQARQ